MIVRNDQDWAAWDFANLQALQLSTRQGVVVNSSPSWI